MSFQIAFLGSPQAFLPFSETEEYSGFSPAAVIAGHAEDDGVLFPDAKRFASLKDALFAFPSLEAAAAAPSFTDDAGEFWEAASLLLSHGKHFFAVIPPSLPSGSVRDLFSCARDAGCLFLPFLPGIGSDGFRDAKGIVSRRELGEILLASEEGVIPGEAAFPAAGFRDALKEIVLPSLLRLRLLFGELRSVSVLAERSGESRTAGRQRPDMVTMQLRFVSGPASSVFFRPEASGSSAALTITGDEDRFTFDPSRDAEPEDDGYYTEFSPVRNGTEFDRAFQDFLLALREEDPRDSLPAEALLYADAVRYAEAAASSALSEGKMVYLD